MAEYKIHPIPLFEMQGEKSLVTFQRGFGRQGTGVNYVWYIEGAPEKIIVDAGGDIDVVSQAKGKIPITDIQSLEFGLNRFGVQPGDIDLVIVTHLHFDHIQLARKFTKARFLVQSKELEFAKKNHPAMPLLGYMSQYYDNLNFVEVEGDTVIHDGLSVLLTPGHTPGGQSVSIQTSKGKAVISGLCTVDRNFNPPEHIAQFMPVILVGIYTDLLESYDSLRRIKETADIIIPLHDEKFKTVSTIP